MTRPEPATADAIGAELDATPHADNAAYVAHFRRLVDAAITAAESRAMERCAKIADVWSSASHFQLHAGEMTAQERRSVAAVVRGVASAIRSSISPPGEKE